jgi:serine/threonine-protein kinase
VADFGIARREGGGYGIVEGKWAYMAPEQARGEPLTPRSDVFALGVVLYELITGSHPFGRQVTHEERDSEPMRVIPPRVVKPSIPPGLDAICMRALAHDPRDRYARMQQMIDALVEERFTNQYREGASDLAQAIRECSVQSPVLAQPRTQITDRPVTIMTRSLIENTPHRRASSPSMSRSNSASASQSRSARGTPMPIPESGAHTANLLSDELIRAAALLEIPPMLRADGTPMPPFRLSHQAMQGPELASVVGGHTATGAVPGIASVPLERNNTRWTIAILGIAALIGAIAAVVIQLTPTTSESSPPPPPAVIEPAPTPAPAITPPAPKEDETKREEQVEAPRTPTIAEVKAPPPDEKIEEKPVVEQKDDRNDPQEPTGAVRTPTKKPVKRPVSTPTKSAEPPGILRVSSGEFTWVYVAGKREEFGKIVLAPGKYTIRVRNPRTAEEQQHTVTVQSGQITPIRIEWEEE